MVNGREQTEIHIGDFVEANLLADPSTIRRGVVINFWGEDSVVVKGWNFESLCKNPRLISARHLSVRDKDLKNWVLEKITSKGGKNVRESNFGQVDLDV